MDWWWFLPLEAESGAPGGSPPHTPSLSVDWDLDLSSDDCSVLSSLGEGPDSWVELTACVTQRIEEFLATSHPGSPAPSPTPASHLAPILQLPSAMEPPSPPHPRPVRGVIVQVAEAVPSHRLDSSGPEPEIRPESAAQVVADLDLDVEEDGCRQDGDGEKEPSSSLQEAPMADLPSPPTNTQGKSHHTTTINSMFSCFRSRHRVGVLVGEADHLHSPAIHNPKPAAKRGWLQRFLRFFRRTGRKG
ncbi:hypothetical protein AMEX_G16703 [Astyanax mexicanus]|uniref:Uncharacterized protein n=1 Tax=Astyanax mexicanus TaxID=7994 RepID=A0A8T2LDY3_ASTMX|nr:hypothetical protein AMEX_G16703 [Astyanax mexicanus]